ncbi:MAG: AIR synthase family protein [Christensenella sp.]|nr:AIR synthase family protein [Christensenella sp.]
MKQGKLTNAQLKRLVIDQIVPQNAETVLGAGVGEDCCAIKIEDGLCVVSTDPITAGGAQTGTLAIHINANDVASAGARPMSALVTLLVPPTDTKEDIAAIMDQLSTTARSLGIDIIGGHTEVTEAVNRMVVSVTMIGIPVIPGKVFKTADMQVGDDILMTKFAGLEGTSILASEFASELKEDFFYDDVLQVEKIKSMFSVVPDGLVAAQIPGVSAMHDITEGGVIGAVCEMCTASGVGAEVDLSKVPILSATSKVCKRYGLDVYGLLSSGSMLIAAQNGERVAQKLAQKGIFTTVIGKATKQRNVYDVTGGEKRKLVPYQADQIFKALER